MLPQALETLDAAVSLLEESGAGAERIGDLVYEVGSIFISSLAASPTPLIARGLAHLDESDGLVWARLKLLERTDATDPRPLRWLNLDPHAVRVTRRLGTEADYARTLDPTEPWTPAEVEQHVERVRAFRSPSARLRGLEVITLRTALWAPDGSDVADRVCEELEQLADEVASPVGQAVGSIAHGALLGARGEARCGRGPTRWGEGAHRRAVGERLAAQVRPVRRRAHAHAGQTRLVARRGRDVGDSHGR